MPRADECARGLDEDLSCTRGIPGEPACPRRRDIDERKTGEKPRLARLGLKPRQLPALLARGLGEPDPGNEGSDLGPGLDTLLHIPFTVKPSKHLVAWLQGLSFSTRDRASSFSPDERRSTRHSSGQERTACWGLGLLKWQTDAQCKGSGGCTLPHGWSATRQRCCVALFSVQCNGTFDRRLPRTTEKERNLPLSSSLATHLPWCRDCLCSAVAE